MGRRFLFGFMIGLMLIALLISGCAKAPVEGPKDTQPIETPEDIVVPSEPEVEKTDMSAELEALLAKSAKVTNYQYALIENGKGLGNFFIKDDKIRISFTSYKVFNDFEYYDVYLDKATGIAYLVCNKVVECKGVKGKEVMWDAFYKETPLDIVGKIDNGAIVETTQIDDKNTAIVEYVNSKGETERVWLWTFRGLPVKIVTGEGDNQITTFFENMVVDPATETSVELPKGLEMI